MSELRQKLADLSRDEKKALFELVRKKKEAAAPTGIERRGESGGPFPLSFPQERLWFIEQLFPGMPTYNIAAIFRLSGLLDVAALSRAVDEIVRRHAVLRTVFTEEDGQPVQRLLPPSPVPFPLIDLTALPPLPSSARDAESLRLVHGESVVPFDLAAGPLLRFRLLRLSEREHLAFFSMHHIVTDGWSMGVFYREVAVLYGAFSAGLPSPLPEIPVQYVDYARWQREKLQGAALEDGLAFWRRELAGVPVLELPTDRRRPAVRSGAGASVAATLSSESSDLRTGLSALLQTGRSTLYMGLLAAFSALLHRLTGQDGFAVGSPVANRNPPEISDLIGFFVNTVALRADLSGDPPFRELLARVRRTVMSAFQHQEIPFEKIVEALQPERLLSHTPLFQVMLSLTHTPPGETVLDGLVLESVPTGSSTSKFDLGLILTEAPGGLALHLEYDLDLFDAATAGRLARHLETLLAGAVAAPDEPVSSLPLLTAAERDHLLLGWNRTARPYPREATVHGLFAEQAEKTPQAVALIAEESVWTYRDLATAAGRLARRLRRLGVGPEVPVAVLVERSPEMVAALLGVLAAGGFFVPLDPGHPPERWAALLTRTGARLVVTQERWLDVLPEGVTAICLDPLETLLAAGEPDGEGLPADWTAPESLAYVMFTSGSTGEPKGVAITHRNIVRLVRGVSYADMGLGEVWAQLAPAAFDGSTLEIWGPLLNGGTLAVAPPRLPSLAELAGFLARHRVTFLLLTAALFHQMAEEQPEGFAPLRRVLAGGDVILPAPVRRLLTAFPALTVVNGYGPTEGTVLTCCWEMRGPAAASAIEDTVPIGNPIANTVVYVLDPQMQPAPIGVWGELHAGGDGLARGYLGRPDLTAERFVPDPFAELHGTPGTRLYRTGDLVRCHPSDARDPQGPEPRIEFLGRNDRQVKIRGFRIEPGEVEAVLASHPQVRQAAVVVHGGSGRDGDGEKRLVAYVACATDWSAELEGELRRHLRSRLPEPMTPSAFVSLPELPLTPNGKVDRQALAAIAPERRGEASVAPRTHTEEVLALLWIEVLGEQRTGGRIGIDDNFFDLGGHSLVATRLVARIRSTLGVDVPLRAVFETPTVAALAALVDSLGVPAKPGHRSLAGLGPEKRSVLFELLRRKSGKEKNREQIRPRRAIPGAPGAPDVPPPPLSFGQERLWFLDRLEPGHTALNMPFALRLRGRLDVAALRRALAAVTDRHEVLRTAFREAGGRPLPVISPPGDLSRTPLPVVDLTGLPERAALVRNLSGALTGTPFDLTTGPVLRACLLRLEPELHVFLLTVHHIAADGWSLGVLTRELTLLYRAFLAGRPSPLPPPALQYGDFASWQREWLQGDVLAAQLAWWRETLAGNPAPLDLPADRPRPAIQTYRGAAARLSLPAALGGALGALSRREGASLFMTLLAGLQILLHRLSGQDDILVGSPIAGRRLSETEGMIGFFLNTLVLRGDLSGDPSFRELLGRVRRNVLGAFTNQDIPFEALLAELQPERDLSRTPFFQVFINMLNFPDEGLSVPGLEVEVGELPDAESKFDLTLYLAEQAEQAGQEGAILLRLSYNADLFDAPRMEELLAQYALLLEQAAAQPEAGIESFSLLTARARAVLPDTALALATETPGVLVHERFAERAHRHPDRPAVVDRDGTWTYGDLDAASRRLARDLIRAGVEPGALNSTVAVWAHRGAALPAALLGVWQAGAAFLILDPAYPEARLAGQIARARPRAWVALPGAGPVPDAVAAALAGLPRLEVAGRGVDAGVEVPERAVPPGAPAYIAFTSGSTGEPKGILGTHGPLSHFFEWHARTFELGEGDRFSLLSGLAHDPLLRDVFTPLWVGGTLCIPGADDLELPGRLASWFAREAVTVAHLTPAMGQLLSVGAAAPLPALRHAFFGGDVLTAGDVETMRRLAPAARLVNFYGATETPQAMGFEVIVEREEAVPARLPLGRGIDGVQLLVLDRAGQMTGIGELGEIVIRTPWLAAGYLDDPAATAERFAADPSPGGTGGRAYRTGDLGRYQPDGEVVFAGRADTQVKVRGFRIETAEVESALIRHPAVREAAVIARGARGEGSDRFLAAFVVPVPDAVPEPEELRAFLAARLPDFMVPAAWEVLDALPLTPNRKVDRRALESRPLADAGRRARVEQVAPRDEVEARIAAIWRELLDVETVGVHDSFFALGGHSLLAARLMAAVRDAYGVEIPLRTLFEKPTLAELAQVVAAARHAGGEAPPDSGIPRLPRVPGEPARFPVSFSQLREWILDCLEPGTPNYNILSNFRISGPLSVPTLAASLQEIVRRHESLRTTFVAAAGGGGVAVGGAGAAEPLQSVAPRLDLALPVIDLSGLAGLPEAAREVELRRRMEHETRTGFDLAAGPLLRARLIRLGPADHAVLFTVHHIVTDGWSMGIFFREITLLYDAFSNGRPSPLPELPVQYGDFAVWQRGRLQGEALETQLGYWRKQLAGAPPLLELPTDRPRPPVRSGRGGKLPVLLPAALIEPLRVLALRQGGSLFMAVLAVFQILLARLSGQDDLAVGTFNGNRGRRELEGLIGFFINTLVLRTDLSGEPGFRELLGRVREVTLGAYAHQDIPFEKLLDVLHLERDPSRTPLFQAMLVLQNFPASRAQLSPGVTIAPLAADTHKADFDLVVWLSEVPEGLGGRVEFSADLFEEATAARMLAQFHRLLGAVTDTAADPEHSIWSLPLLAPEERDEILGAWSRTAEAPEGEPLLHRLVAAQAEATPEAVAVESAAGRLTYGELAERSRALAATLRESGIGPESLVGLAAESSPDLLVGMLAVLAAGGAYLPLDPAYPPERQAFMLEDSGAVLLDRLAPLSRRQGGGGRGDGGEGPQGYGVEADNPAYVIYTSGSTGRPKGVLVPHRAIAAYTRTARAYYGIGPGDRVLQFASISFDTSGEEIWPALSGGATLVLRPEDMAVDIPHFVRELARLGITVLNLPTAFWHELAAGLDAEGLELPRGLRLVVIGGEEALAGRLAAWHRRAGPGVRLVNTYGPTEATIVATHRELGAGIAFEVPIGRPIPGARAYAVDRLFEPVPPGVRGELLLGGSGVARGYLGRPDATAERFVPDPFSGVPGARLYRTGDLAIFRVGGRAGGELVFAGRADRQVKLRGYRIEPGEIEAALRLHPALHDAAVDVRGSGEARRLVAWVVAREGAPPAGPELRAFLRDRLPEPMVPAVFVPLPRLPLSPSGKVDRRALPDPEGERPDLATGYVEPGTALERTVAGIFRDLLQVARVGLNDNFFDLGGHSLLVIRAHQRLREALGREISVIDLFRFPTVALLARHLGKDEEKPSFEKVQDLAERQRAAQLRQKQAMERMRRPLPGKPGKPGKR
jgi:amino acid adenylation domain-containing protein